LRKLRGIKGKRAVKAFVDAGGIEKKGNGFLIHAEWADYNYTNLY
jgi:hypothetical protein